MRTFEPSAVSGSLTNSQDAFSVFYRWALCWHCAQMLMDYYTGSARIDWFPLQKASVKHRSPDGHSDLFACTWQKQQVLLWNVRALSPEHSGEVAALVSQLRLKSAWKPWGQLTHGKELWHFPLEGDCSTSRGTGSWWLFIRALWCCVLQGILKSMK